MQPFDLFLFPIIIIQRRQIQLEGWVTVNENWGLKPVNTKWRPGGQIQIGVESQVPGLGSRNHKYPLSRKAEAINIQIKGNYFILMMLSCSEHEHDRLIDGSFHKKLEIQCQQHFIKETAEFIFPQTKLF